jgi:transcriptional regulator PpsR
MDKLVSRDVCRSFRDNGRFLADLDAEAVSKIVTAGADIALVLSPDGDILDIAYRDTELKAWGLEEWVGRRWHDTVTVESRDKLRDLLSDSSNMPMTRSRQVNHPGDGARDLPVSYRVASLASGDKRLALGSDERAMADMQQRLVRAQFEMERDYRRVRDIEARYRIIFHLAYEPLLVVDSQSLKVLDANEGAARLFARPAKKLTGGSVTTAFAKGEQQAMTEALAAIAARGREDVVTARIATLDEPVSVRVTPFREFGRTNLLVCFMADHDLAGGVSSVSSMLAMAESLPDGLVVVDGEGRILEANMAFLDMIRVVGFDRIEGKSVDLWVGGSGVDLQVLMANLREHGTVRRFSTIIRDDLGGSETVELSAARINGTGGPRFGLSVRESQRPEPGMAPLGAVNGQSASHLTELVGRVPLKDLVRDTADIIEKLCIEAALKLTDNNRASAADMLGLSRQSLYIKLRRYGISDSEEETG